MIAEVETLIKDIISSLQVAKLYTVAHPRFKKYIAKTYESLKRILQEKDELVIGIIEGEFVFEKEIFFDLSKTAKQMVDYLKERGVEKIVFFRLIREEELSKLIEFLAMRKTEVEKDLQEYLKIAGVRNIFVGKVQQQSASDLMSSWYSISTMYDNSFSQLSGTIDAVLDDEQIDYLALRFSMCNIMDNLIEKYKQFLQLTALKRLDTGTFSHILNVAILAMYFSQKIGFAREDVLDIGTAAIFHDIGKLYISRRIIKKPERLTD